MPAWTKPERDASVEPADALSPLAGAEQVPGNVSASFSGIPIIGMDAVIRRGTKPSAWRIRVPHDADLTAEPGDLVFESQQGIVTVKNVIPDLSTLRVENLGGRREYSLIVRDRRKWWDGGYVTAKYNRRYRDNTLDSGTKIKAGAIADMALKTLGETPSVASDLGDTYPSCDWSGQTLAWALDELLSLVPSHLCWTKDDKFEIRPTGDGDGIEESWPLVTPNYLADIDGGPKIIRAVLNKTWFECPLQLEAVGLDSDDTWQLLDDLDYRPTAGWEKEWPSLFSGVPAGERQKRAFATVFRCYRVKMGQGLPWFDDDTGEQMHIYSPEDIDLDDLRMNRGENECPRALVVGTFWPMGDHPYNTQNCPVLNCDFHIDKQNAMVIFEYPIFKMGSCIAPADLWLLTSFHLRRWAPEPIAPNSTAGWYKQSYTIERDKGWGEWTVNLPHLWRAQRQTISDCEVAENIDNEETVKAEAQTYLDLWKAHFDAIAQKRDVTAAGIIPVSLSGRNSEIHYRLGRGLIPETRVCQNYEPSR